MANYETASRTKDYNTSELFERFPQIVSIAPQLELDGSGLPTGNAIIHIGIAGDNAIALEGLGIPESLPAISEAGTEMLGESVPVVVSIEGAISLEQNTGRRRPCPGGFSIGHFRITAGTLGGVARLGSGPFNQVLSNNHVLADENTGRRGDVILQPGSFDGGRQPNDNIGTLNRFVRVSLTSNNEVDCAFATSADVDRNVFGIGVPQAQADASVGDAVRKSGRTTGLTTGSIVSTNASLRLNFAGGTATFVNQLQYSRMTAGGDSGSLIWLQDSLTVVGLHFAGSSTASYGNKILRVLDLISNSANSFDEDGNVIEAPAISVSLLGDC